MEGYEKLYFVINIQGRIIQYKCYELAATSESMGEAMLQKDI